MRTPGGGQGLTVGDPHLRTFDGLKYDCQAVGEFTLVRDPVDQLEIQTRTAPWGSSLNLAANIAVAARVGTDTVAFYVDGHSILNGASASFAAAKTILPAGGEVYVSGSLLTLVWPDGSQMRMQFYDSHIDLELFVNAARAGRLSGLLGNFDAVAAGDLVTRAGAALEANPSLEDFYGKYVESWRINQQNSLFTYAAGETTETKTDRAFPHTGATSAALTAAQRAAAAAACAAAGVQDPHWLDSCLLDVGRTGDSSFAAGLATAAGPRMTVDLQPSTCPAAGSRVVLGLAPTDPERVVNLQWITSSGDPTSNLIAEGGGLTCQDPSEFFGQSYGAPEGTPPGPVVAGHMASITSCGLQIDVVGGPTDCSGVAQLPVTTTYLSYADARASQLRVARTFGFGPTTPHFGNTGLRPYVPRLALSSFSTVIYPNQAGTGVTTANTCGGDCFVATGPTWNGKWFADVAPATGYAMIVLRDPTMISPVYLTINNDGSSASNLASFVLLEPVTGWTAPVTEVEYLCFADLVSWPQDQRDAAQLPAGCGP